MSKNVFKDLGFGDEEAAGLKLKSYLFIALQEAINDSGLNQKEVAAAIGADQPKVSKIINGKFNEFAIERLVEYLERLGYEIRVSALPIDRPRRAKAAASKRVPATAAKRRRLVHS